MPDLHFHSDDSIEPRLRELAGDEDASAADAAPQPPHLLLRLWRYLQSIDCRTMVEERDASDDEYYQEFLQYYATTFIPHPPTATRLHFFGDAEEVVRAVLDPTNTDVQPSQTRYLGYCVLRPSWPPTVGPAMLHAPKKANGSNCFVHCATRFGQTIRGRRFHVPAAPFIGRDQTGMCAQAAIWGACRYLHKYCYYPQVSLPEVSLLAHHQLSDAAHLRRAEGLTQVAIHAALSKLGFQIYVADLRPHAPDLDSPTEAVYTAIESGLPALLLLKDGDPDGLGEGHAVWVAGHAFDPEVRADAVEPEFVGTRSKPRLRFLSASSWARDLLVHDDAVGPYLRTRIGPGDSEAGDGEPEADGVHTPSSGRRFHLVDYLDHKPQDHNGRPASANRTATQVIVPLPEEVVVRPPDARRTALAILLANEQGGHLASLLHSRPASASEVNAITRDFVDSLSAHEDERLRRWAFRTYLCLSDRFREYVVASRMCDDLKEFYAAQLQLPEFAWVTEVSDAGQMDSDSSTARVVGEVLIDPSDATAVDARSGFRYLALHIPGMVAWRRGLLAGEQLELRSDTPPEFGTYVLPEDGAYQPYHLNSDIDEARPHKRLGLPHSPKLWNLL
ncbi:MAG: hypothetical protein GF393_09430 [Armatimonadia bacterium]|nr:hypothetical protein [Armatimonadia bacterium]